MAPIFSSMSLSFIWAQVFRAAIGLRDKSADFSQFELFLRVAMCNNRLINGFIQGRGLKP